MRTQPLAFASAMEPASMRWSYDTISALMKPRWKSVWITPAACGAVAPTGIVQARASFGPGEVGLQSEGGEADAGQLVEAGLLLADGGQQLGGLLGGQFR